MLGNDGILYTQNTPSLDDVVAVIPMSFKLVWVCCRGELDADAVTQ